jgi:hypothetical protein
LTARRGAYEWNRLRFIHGPYTAAAFKNGDGAPNVTYPKSGLIRMDALAGYHHIGMIQAPITKPFPLHQAEANAVNAPKCAAGVVPVWSRVVVLGDDMSTAQSERDQHAPRVNVRCERWEEAAQSHAHSRGHGRGARCAVLAWDSAHSEPASASLPRWGRGRSGRSRSERPACSRAHARVRDYSLSFRPRVNPGAPTAGEGGEHEPTGWSQPHRTAPHDRYGFRARTRGCMRAVRRRSPAR